ncbi:hypothetical protein FB565_008857 [Actinoplanes lutulentus]|uniref:Uncharacterized protein n=1 Tax=Actinoplanes lutulentus TaxID=1287878 RepID=A0A327Z5L7_9ACTN|nr:hypothetical protein [Actinoplanes lutulentus]MBB2949052.1 hypothetical protein [Actinoplanes lutulentus]RAK31375.1 hypothetical protein B0I29_115182 [Actinoplanes lutulentus]
MTARNHRSLPVVVVMVLALIVLVAGGVIHTSHRSGGVALSIDDHCETHQPDAGPAHRVKQPAPRAEVVALPAFHVTTRPVTVVSSLTDPPPAPLNLRV